MIIDTHAHYDDEAFDTDREALLTSMYDGGIEKIVNVCASVGGFQDTVKLMEKYPFVYGAVGIHPDDADKMTQETLDEIRSGSKENIKGEFSNNGVDNDISHTRGTISMARASDPDSASSQFFIVQADSTFLDGDYAGFGHVTEGMDIVDKICEDAKPTDDNGTIPSDQQPVIEKITITD